MSPHPMSGPQEPTSTIPGGGKGPCGADTSLARGTASAPTVLRQPPSTAVPAEVSGEYLIRVNNPNTDVTSFAVANHW
jgi:hypothetical protein